jgi:predicted HicB family RNase H-like nuclease
MKKLLAEEKNIFCVRLPKKTYEKIKKIAKKDGVSINSIFSKLISAHIADKEKG